jgi:hypothetical protein
MQECRTKAVVVVQGRIAPPVHVWQDAYEAAIDVSVDDRLGSHREQLASRDEAAVRLDGCPQDGEPVHPDNL